MNAVNKNCEQIAKIVNKPGLFTEVAPPSAAKKPPPTEPPYIKKPGIATGLCGVDLKLFRVDNIKPFVSIRNAVPLLTPASRRNQPPGRFKNTQRRIEVEAL